MSDRKLYFRNHYLQFDCLNVQTTEFTSLENNTLLVGICLSTHNVKKIQKGLFSFVSKINTDGPNLEVHPKMFAKISKQSK